MPLPNHLPDTVKNNIPNGRERILSIVKNYVDTHLDPRKRNILHPHKENFEDILSMKNILAELKVTEEEHYGAPSISSDSNFPSHLKQKLNARFINNFFVEGLQAWKLNIDIQPVFNHYKAVTYMCS